MPDTHCYVKRAFYAWFLTVVTFVSKSQIPLCIEYITTTFEYISRSVKSTQNKKQISCVKEIKNTTILFFLGYVSRWVIQTIRTGCIGYMMWRRCIFISKVQLQWVVIWMEMFIFRKLELTTNLEVENSWVFLGKWISKQGEKKEISLY